jgi:GNAT superfamily N-acetyltransferase
MKSLTSGSLVSRAPQLAGAPAVACPETGREKLTHPFRTGEPTPDRKDGFATGRSEPGEASSDSPANRRHITPPRTLNMTIDVAVRQARANDEAGWRELWVDYGHFSNVKFAPAVIDSVWKRICEPESPMKALIAADTSGVVLGFLNFVVHDFTFSDRPACVADDLYVRPGARGLGIGSLLLSSLVGLARSEDWARVYWVARETNIAARRLFDAYFTKADGYVRYSVDLTTDRAAE